MSNNAIVAIGAAIPSLPFVVVAIIGLAMSMSRWSRFPRVARWATIGFTSLLLQGGLSLVDQYNASASAGSLENEAHNLVWITTAMYLLKLLSLVALTMAVFAERTPHCWKLPQ